MNKTYLQCIARENIEASLAAFILDLQNRPRLNSLCGGSPFVWECGPEIDARSGERVLHDFMSSPCGVDLQAEVARRHAGCGMPVSEAMM